DTSKTACPADPAFGSQKITVDFTQGASSVFTEAAGANVQYGAKGAVFTISEAGQAPSFTSNNYLFFGTVEVTMQVAPGQGIVSTFFLESDDLDEIDWEWLGGADKNSFGQSNFFSSHDMTYGVNEIDIPVSSPQTEMHTYTIDWSPTQLVWKVDGVALRTLPYAGNENVYPQTPMQIKLGTWCGGCSSANGTVEWAGGAPDWSQAPFIAYYQKVTIQDSSNGVANAVSYQYTDESGTKGSIKINTGNAGFVEPNSSAAKPTATTMSSVVSSASSSTSSAAGAQSTGTAVSPTTAKSATSAAAASTGSLASANSGSATSSSSTSSTTGSGSSSTPSPVQGEAGRTSAANLALAVPLMLALVVL
ncbi:concanavalin A-like lectin/glucanase domain-containing protein, partial [Coniella lustricola]